MIYAISFSFFICYFLIFWQRDQIKELTERCDKFAKVLADEHILAQIDERVKLCLPQAFNDKAPEFKLTFEQLNYLRNAIKAKTFDLLISRDTDWIPFNKVNRTWLPGTVFLDRDYNAYYIFNEEYFAKILGRNNNACMEVYQINMSWDKKVSFLLEPLETHFIAKLDKNETQKPNTI